MIRLPDQLPRPGQRARDEAAAAWEHLLSAAEHGARQLGDTSRRTSRIARKRASYAALALRGEYRASRWRWLGVGLAAGVVLGAAGTVALTRRRGGAGPATEATPEPADAAAHPVRERAGATLDAVREHTGAVAQRAAAAARDTATRVRDAVTPPSAAEPSEPSEPSRPTGPAETGPAAAGRQTPTQQ